jgi:hypothetical protein
MNMKRLVVMVGATALFASLVTGGKANFVTHVNDDGSKYVKFMSGGACRHHLSAHPQDTVSTLGGPSGDPASCE